ncbi:MAG: class I SAM-dependent methyltransferase [bacterium]|nr:class I SAM-dependent methyltransferase [bacterium]
MNKPKVIETKYGYFELKKKPTSTELKNYYSKLYYQNQNAHYQKSYSECELEHFNSKISQTYYKICDLLPNSLNNASLLDIGCGEGFFLKFFKEKKWKISGIDFSNYGCKTHNIDCLENLIVGNVYDEIDNLINFKKKYDVIIAKNLLEHVINPEAFIIKIKKLLSSHSILVVEVPNDFSPIQSTAINNGKITEEFWIGYPDHISYFNRKGLKKLLETNGYETCSMQTDFPIDLFLLNDSSNYIKNKAVGKHA